MVRWLMAHAILPQGKTDAPDSKEVQQSKADPTLPVRNQKPCSVGCVKADSKLKQARFHGNEPSRGAKIDAELKAEEEEELRKKGKK